jgi:ribosome-binding factor A
METKRQHKFARMIQKEIGEIFQREVKSYFGNAFITVTQVRVSPDFSMARIYLSLMMIKDKKQLLEDIAEKKPVIRKYLGERMGKTIRIIPDLHFFLDDSVDYSQNIERILKEIKSSHPE